MIVKGIQDETFQDYRKVGMLIAAARCDWKCERECGCAVCQNTKLAQADDISFDNDDICVRYLSNQLTYSVIFGGLEPMLQFHDVIDIVDKLRNKFSCNDDIIVYTGYEKHEVTYEVERLRQYPNIIVKFGRYIPNRNPIYDNVLGVWLASDNQHAERIS